MDVSGLTFGHDPLRIALFVAGLIGILGGLVWLAGQTHQPMSEAPEPVTALAVPAIVRPPPDPEKSARLRNQLLGLPDPDGVEVLEGGGLLASVDADGIAAVVQEAQPRLQACLVREAGRHPGIANAPLVLTILVDHRGVAQEVTLGDAALDATRLGACLSRVVRRLRFRGLVAGADAVFRIELPLEPRIGV